MLVLSDLQTTKIENSEGGEGVMTSRKKIHMPLGGYQGQGNSHQTGRLARQVMMMCSTH
jgi:hypothetical protein